MSIYVKTKASIYVAHDAQFTELAHQREDVIISETMTYQESGTVKIAAAASHVVDLGSIAEIKSLYIETESDVDVLLDVQTEPIQLRPGSTSGKARVVIDGLSATALKFTATAGSDAVVTYQIVGD